MKNLWKLLALFLACGQAIGADYFTASGNPSTGAALSSQVMRAEFASIAAGFVKIAPYTGNGGKIIAINSGGTAQEAITTTGTGSGVRATSPTFTTSVISGSTTMAIFNTVATTVNAFGGASTALNVGHASGTNTVLGATTFSQAITLSTASNLGTPSTLVGTNITGTAAGLTAGTASAVAVGGITGLGTGVATFLATPSSANLAAAVTGETGSGALVFGTSPTLADPTLTGTLTAAAINASGAITSTVTANSLFAFNSATTSRIYMNGSNTGGAYIAGIDSSAGGGITAGTAAYSTVIGSSTATSLHLITNNAVALTIASTGEVTIPGALTSGALTVTGTISATSYIAGTEETEPAAPAANGYRIFAVDSGGGKTILKVRFASGASQTIATEP